MDPLSPRDAPLVTPHRRDPARLRERAVALFEVLLCSGFPTQIVLALVLKVAGIEPFHTDQSLSLSYVFVLTLADSAILIALIAGFLAASGERASDVLFPRGRRWQDALLGALLLPIVFFIAFGVLIALRLAAPWLHNLAKNPLENLIGSRRDAAMFAVVAIVGGGVREEMQRGFILHRFDQHLGGGWIGLVLYSAAFGAGHVLQGWDAAVTLTFLGAFWGLIYLSQRSILPAMVSHAAFNTAEIIRYTLRT